MSVRRTINATVSHLDWSAPDPDAAGGEFEIRPINGNLDIFVQDGGDDPPLATSTVKWTVAKGSTYKVDVEDSAYLYWRGSSKEVRVEYTFGGHPA